jgi:hypothetical protein
MREEMSEIRPVMELKLRRCISRSALVVLALSLGACASSPVGHGTAADMFYRLKSPGQRQVANDFYSQGLSDEAKNLYWAQRRMQEPGYDSERPPVQRKYVSVWVPEQKAPDGTIIEGHYKVIEVVE